LEQIPPSIRRLAVRLGYLPSVSTIAN